jgi:hypothetical protein
MRLSRVNLYLAGVASWLNNICRVRTLTNHLPSIRQNNPQVHQRVVHARRRHICHPAQRRRQPPAQPRMQPPAQQQPFPMRPGFQGPNLQAVIAWDVAANQAHLTRKSRYFSFKCSQSSFSCHHAGQGRQSASAAASRETRCPSLSI